MNKICKGTLVPPINTKIKLGRAMKLTSIALFVFTTGVCASVHSQNMRVNIHLNNAKTGTVLEEIEKQTDYLFIYNAKEVDLNREVSISAQDETVAKVLSSIFDGTNVAYAMEGSNIMLMEKTSTASAPQQDTRQITGTVVDATGTPVIGANVMVKGTTNGTITDMDGKFTLEVAKDAILQVSYIGYTNQEISVGNKSVLRISLKERLNGIFSGTLSAGLIYLQTSAYINSDVMPYIRNSFKETPLASLTNASKRCSGITSLQDISFASLCASLTALTALSVKRSNKTIHPLLRLTDEYIHKPC